jgi:hypothetical protein
MLVCHLHVFYGGGEQFGHSQRGIIGMSAKECIDALYQPRGIGFARQTFLVSKPRRASMTHAAVFVLPAMSSLTFPLGSQTFPVTCNNTWQPRSTRAIVGVRVTAQPTPTQ